MSKFTQSFRLFSHSIPAHARLQFPRFTQSQQKSNRGRTLLITLGVVSAGVLSAAGIWSFYDPVGFKRKQMELVRTARISMAIIAIVVDYKWSLRDSNSPELIGLDKYLKIKSDCHQRSADRLLSVARANGGVYIKLGQHIAALVYLLPSEYTETMKVLQDKAPKTSLADIKALFEKDLNISLDTLFSDFDPNPVGVASLAQVHKATLRETGQKVAVKIQHPSLEDHSPVDIRACMNAVKYIKRIFPDFEFTWLADEMRINLPKELDFEHEAANSERVKWNFYGNKVLKLPDIYWASKRILVMEFMEGSRIDDVEYMKKHQIKPSEVSTELSKIFSEMIFVHGFVHCDPHPANVFIKPCPNYKPSFFSKSKNFQIVLLDHGLYRELSPEFQLDYAHLWESLINGNESMIEYYAYRLFTYDDRPKNKHETTGIHQHRLFASMLTGRSWDAISNNSAIGGGLATARTNTELATVAKNAQNGHFFKAIVEVLANVPRELLLLFKTNDLLRSVDSALGVGKVGSQVDDMLKIIRVMGWYCAKCIRRETEVEGIWSIAYWRGLFEYLNVGFKLWILGVYLTIKM